METKPPAVPRHRQLPIREQPQYRAAYQPEACNALELVAAVVGGARQLEIAESLFATFGSVDSIAQATPQELLRVHGVHMSTAVRVRAAFHLERHRAASVEAQTFASPEDVYQRLKYEVSSLTHERLYVLLLDTRNRLIGTPRLVYQGSLNTSLIRVGELFRDAIKASAASMIVAHNHPSGDPAPSPEDIAVTRAMVQAGDLLDVEVLDHVVIGKGGYTSLKAKGLGFS